MKTHRKRGFTLTEIAIVMGVAGMIIGAIWLAAGSARETQKENSAIAEMQNVVQNIMGLMMGQTFSVAANTNITSTMITAQTIPGTYVDTASATTADNPWSAKNFYVYAMSARTFRITFYKVATARGCIALLTEGTACQAGQVGCPTAVWTGGTVGGSTSTPTSSSCVAGNCNGTVNSAIGWQVMGPAAATALCALNSYTGGTTNSVEFDYSL